MDKQVQAPGQSFRARMYSRDRAIPKEQRILVLRTGIAGVQYHIENEDEEAALNSIAPGTELKLYREPDNQYDEWAIAVYLTDEDQLGYISRFKNEAIARLMDAGKKFIAVAEDPAGEQEEGEDGTGRPERHAATENMAYPVGIYLVE